jgi:AAA domain/DnaA N-terminal domain
MRAELVRSFTEAVGDSAGDHLWERMSTVIAAKVTRQCFDTWFAPIRFAGCDGKACSLIVPNACFRQGLLDNYAALLEEAIFQAAGKKLRLDIALRDQDAQADGASLLQVLRASALHVAEEQKPWLIERLWSASAVGIVSGPPKALKTWTALEMAIAVAAGVPCLSSFPVHRSGVVLLYAAEEPLPALHSRLQALARNHGLQLDDLDIRVIAADSLRLDRQHDREKLTATVAFHHPVLLILDPLIRLHGLDENQSGPMAELLGYFRALQRSTGTAIAIVHHSRKNGGSSSAPGQSLRGSSDLYAFVDSLVSLDRRRDQVTISAEHRSAPALAPLPIELVPAEESNQCPSLRLRAPVDDSTPMGADLPDRILQCLAAARVPVTTDVLRSNLQVRKQRVIEALRGLLARGLVMRTENGYESVSVSRSN